MQRRGPRQDPPRCELTGCDVAGCLALCAFAAVLSVVGFQALRPAILDHETFNYWFEGDASALYEQMTSRFGEVHERSSRHPLFSLLSGVPVAAIGRLGVPAEALVAVWMGLAAALWIALLFAALRALGLPTASALAYSLLCSASAAAWFTLPVPGHFVLGSATILAALLVVILAERGVDLPAWVLIGVAAATLAVTITNWVAGLLMLLFCAGLRRGAWMAAASLGVVSVLFGVQALLVPHARQLPLSGNEGRFLFNPLRGGPLEVAGVFFGSAMSAPEVRGQAGSYLSVQHAWPGTGSPWATAALAGWIALLVLAVLRWRRWRWPRSTSFLVAVLAAQLALHEAFGAETLLYALHWIPLLVAFAALAAVDPGARRPATALAAAVAVLATVANGQAFAEARGHLLERYRQRTAFVEDVRALTNPGELLVVGFDPGPNAVSAGAIPEPAFAPPRKLERVQRRGWPLREEHWTLDRIEHLRARGARYFVSGNAHGLGHSASFVAELARRFRVLARTETHLVVELDSPTVAVPALADPASSSAHQVAAER